MKLLQLKLSVATCCAIVVYSVFDPDAYIASYSSLERSAFTRPVIAWCNIVVENELDKDPEPDEPEEEKNSDETV